MLLSFFAKQSKGSGRRVCFNGVVWIGLTFLFACQACPRTPTDDATSREVQEAEPVCRVVNAREVPQSYGRGPIAVGANAEGTWLLAQSDLPGGRLTLSNFQDGSLQPATRQTVGERSLGPLHAGAIAVSRSNIVLAGLQEGGRRAYLFNRSPEGEFALVESASRTVLGQRTNVGLITPRAGAGIQVLNHLSGTTTIDVGRIAGGLVVTRSFDVPTQLAVPVATSTPTGGLLVVSLERLQDGSRNITAREVAPEGAVLGALEVWSVPGTQRIDRLAVDHSEGHYRISWRSTDSANSAQVGRSAIGRATIDEVSSTIQILNPVVADQGHVTSLRHLLWPERSLSAWSVARDSGSSLLLGSESEEGNLVAISQIDFDGQLIESLQASTGTGSPELYWRQLALGADGGPIMTADVTCP